MRGCGVCVNVFLLSTFYLLLKKEEGGKKIGVHCGKAWEIKVSA